MADHIEHDAQLGDRISGSLSDDVFEGLQHEKSRLHITKIVEEYTKHEDFIERVRKYAGQEMDSRLFISSKFWITTIIAALISGGIGAALVHFFGH